MPTPRTEAQPTAIASSDFDVIEHYNHLLTSDPALTKPVAAIESLIALLSTSPLSTISETLALLDSSTAKLKSCVTNPLALSAGTDLFQKYIISANIDDIRKRSASADEDNFQALRAHLLANARLFVQRAKEARAAIARNAKRFVRHGSSVLICGNSRVVAAVLQAAVEDGVIFNVIYVQSHSVDNSNAMVTDLRTRGVPVAIVPFSALATVLSQSSLAMVGAESVVENGGIISSMGTYQLGLLAKALGKPFYVVAESHKFVRVYPLSGGDLVPVAGLLRFELQDNRDKTQASDSIDFTPPDLITALVTESGVHGPSAVSEELIKLWY